MAALEAEDLSRLRAEVDALEDALALERFRHVAGMEPAPALAAIFRAHPAAAHRETVARLRAGGEESLAGRVARLRAERAAAAREEAWRAADAAAVAAGPDGPLSGADALARLPREEDSVRRRALARAASEALAPSASHREAAGELRARALAEVGEVPDWERVVEADALLAASDDAWREVLSWRARRSGLAPAPRGDLTRADLLHLLAVADLDGLFPPGALASLLRETLAPLGLGLGAVRIDDQDGARPARWPGAHALGSRVSLRRQGGVADLEGLLQAVGAALAAAHGPPPHARHPAHGGTVGALLAGLLLDPGFLERRLGLERRASADVVRLLALRRLFALRTRAAGLRVATEVERGLSGETWRRAHREALGLAALAAWPEGLAGRDADAGAARAGLGAESRAEALRRALVERLDEDWWRNPRAAEVVAGLLAGGPGQAVPLGLAAEALVDRMG